MNQNDIKTLEKYLSWQRKKSYFSELVYINKTRLIGRLARIISYRSFNANSDCDVLFLYRSKQGLKQPELVNELRKIGFSIKEFYLPTNREILCKRYLLKDTSLFRGYYLEQLFSHYLAKKYAPKVIINDKQGSSFTPFLRHYVNLNHGKLVQLAHSIPTSNYRRFGMLDFDHYFIYGQSSIDNINNLDKKYGNSELIPSGSIQIERKIKSNNAVKIQTERPFLIVLGSGPSLEASDSNIKNCYRHALAAAHKLNLECYFKPHPRSNLNLWEQVSGDTKHQRVIHSLNVKPNQALCAVSSYTNAIIDCAILGIPTVTYELETTPDFFKAQKYFGCFVNSKKDLVTRISTIKDNKQYYLAQTKIFTDYHLASQKDSHIKIARAIERIVNQS